MSVQMKLECQGREQDLWAGTASHQTPLGSVEQDEEGSTCSIVPVCGC